MMPTWVWIGIVGLFIGGLVEILCPIRWITRPIAPRRPRYPDGRHATIPLPEPDTPVVVLRGDVWGNSAGEYYAVRRPERLRNGQQAWAVVQVVQGPGGRWLEISKTARMHRWAVVAGRWHIVARQAATGADDRDPPAA